MSSDDKPKFLGHYLEGGALTPKPEPLSDSEVAAFMVQLANERDAIVERMKSVMHEALIAHVDRAKEYKALLEGIIGSDDA